MKFRRWMQVFLLIALPLSGWSAWKTDATMKVAVITFNVSGNIVDPAAITEYFQGQIVDKKVFIVVERSQLEQILSEQQMELSGMTTQDYTRIGKMVGADKLITGSIAKIGQQYIITIKGIDVSTAAVEFSDQAVVPNADAIIEVIPAVVDRFVKKASGQNVPSFSYDNFNASDYNNVQVSDNSSSSTVQGNSAGNTAVTPGSGSDYSELAARLRVSQNRITPRMSRSIRMYSARLPYNTREGLYNQYRKQGLVIAVLNIFPTLGGWIYGDYTDSTLTLLGFAAGIVMISYGQYTGDIYTEAGGDIVFIGSYVFNLVSPFIYAGGYNRRLRNSLSLNVADAGSPARYAYTHRLDTGLPVYREDAIHIDLIRVGF